MQPQDSTVAGRANAILLLSNNSSIEYKLIS